jgi:glycosyltransferase involved in cell wall biosynthesis
MKQSKPLWFLVPGDLDTPTGGYRYDRRIVAGLSASGWSVTVEQLDDSFPQPTALALDDAERRLAAIPEGAMVIVDGLAFGAMPDVAAAHAQRLRLIALVHHPLALETGLTHERVEALRLSEARALSFARRILVTSSATASVLAAAMSEVSIGALSTGDPSRPGPFHASPDRIRVVEPGVDLAPLAVGSGDLRLNLLCVAAATPRKGHDVLLRALAPLIDRPWRLDCVGSLDRCPATATALRRLCAELGLSDRVHFTGAVDEVRLVDYYHHADVFVLPTRLEGYGMVLTEALARGLPVISTETGPIPTIVPPEAGILVAPDDPAALQRALTEVLDDPTVLGHLSAGARVLRGRLSSWDEAATEFGRALDALSDG